MKTIFKTFSLCLIFTFSMTFAQAQNPFTSESSVLHAGFGIGGYDVGFGAFGVNSTPIISASFDKGLIDDLGIGNLGIGGAIGFKHYSIKDSDTSWNRLFLAARGTYHFNWGSSDVLDLYAGIHAGAVIFVSDVDGLNTDPDPFAGPFVGLNYYFSPSFGVYAEAGYGLGFINGGIALGF